VCFSLKCVITNLGLEILVDVASSILCDLISLYLKPGKRITLYVLNK